MNSTDTTRKQNGELVDRLSAALPARLHVVVGPEDGTYTAYAIEFDIVGQGETAEAAVDEMFALVREYVRKAIELNEIENLVRPMPRLEILRLKFKVWRSRAENMLRHSARFAAKTLDRPALQHELRLAA